MKFYPKLKIILTRFDMKEIKHEKDQVTKKFSTNKAVFEISGDRLTKKYFKTGDALSDYLLLKKIQDNYQHQQKGEWIYRSLKVYKNPSKNVIQMEYVPGQTIRRVFEGVGKSDIYYHMGMWLGILHICTTEPGSELALTYPDFTDGNFLLDTDKKIAVGIDPGNYKNLLDHPSISIVTGAFSIQRGVLKGSKNYLKVWLAIYFYLSGYLNGSKRSSLPKLNKGIVEISRRQKVFWYFKKEMSFGKKVVRTGEIILLTVKIKLIAVLFKAKNVF